MADVRGLVVSPPVKIRGTTASFGGGGLDQQELRFSLLFWDKLDHPAGILSIHGGPEAEFLQRIGILTRTAMPLRPEFNAQGEATIKVFVHGAQVGADQLKAFRILDEREPGVWSLATGEHSIVFDDQDLQEGKGALVKLHRALPVPHKDVPLEDVLEFRKRRRAELLALRHHLEQIYQRILNAGDGELAINTELGVLDRAIADHIKVSKESGLKFCGVSFNASLNLIDGVKVAAATYAATLSTSASLLAGTAAAISIGPDAALSWSKPTGTPYQYVSAYYQEVF